MHHAMLAAGGGDPVVFHLIFILAAAGLVAALTHALRLATVPAYLIAGVIIGGSGFDIIGQVLGEGSTSAAVSSVGNLAIVLLLFGIGMHMDLKVLRRGAFQLVGSGLTCVVGCTVLLWPMAMLGGFDARASLVAALALCLSSTAVVMGIMTKRRELHRISGRLNLSILIVQDIAVIGILLLLPLLARTSGTEEVQATSLGQLAVDIVIGLVVIGGISFFGRVCMPWLLGRAAKHGSASEVLTILSVAYALAAAGGTASVGLSPELGAFLAGFLLSTTAFRHQLMGQVAPVRDLFLAVFFVTVGMQVDLKVVVGELPRVLGGMVAVLTTKAIVIGFVVWAFGATRSTSAKVGLSLAQAGEFGLILLGVSFASLGLLTSEEHSVLVAVVVLTLIVAPSLMSFGDIVAKKITSTKLAPWVGSTALTDGDTETEGDVEDERPLVIVAGFGVVGRAVVDRLCGEGVRTVVIEMNAETVKKQKALGRSIMFGDVADPEVLQSAGVMDASAMVLTVPDDTAGVRATRIAKSLKPDLPVVVRAQYVSRASEAKAQGADHTVIEEIATAMAMERLVERVVLERDTIEEALKEQV